MAPGTIRRHPFPLRGATAHTPGGHYAGAVTTGIPPLSGEPQVANADAPTEQARESLALSVGAIAFVVTGVVALIVFRYGSAPISGHGSVGQFAAMASAVVAVLAFAAGRYVVRDPGRRIGVFDVITVTALAVAHGVIAFLTWSLLAFIMKHGFIDAVVFPTPVLVLSGSAAAVTAYLVFFSATHMDLLLLAVILAVFLAEGVIASMLTASDPHWWHDNLSALGMPEDVSSLAFNLTIIVSGILVTTIARLATRGIPDDRPHGVRNVRICLIVVGIFLSCVGLFPVDDFFLLHTGCASGMVAVFGVAVIFLPRWIPAMPRAFVLVGWLFLAVTLVLSVMFMVGYYTLTAVELVGGVLIFTWIILFIRNAAALQQDVLAPVPAAAEPAL